MSLISNLILADGKATPANHTFVPQTPQVGDKPAVWFEPSANSPLGYFQVTAHTRFNASGVSKVRLKISLPNLATPGAGCCVDTNTPVVSYTQIADLQFSIPMNATTDQRKDLLAFAKSLLGTTMASDAVVNLQTAW